LFAASPAELAERERLFDAAAAFWRAVEHDAEPNEAIACVHPELYVERGPRDAAALLLRCERRALRPLVDAVIERAPAGWRGRAFGRLPAIDVKQTESIIRERLDIDVSQGRARAGFTRGHLLEIVVMLPGAEERADGACDAAEAVCESLLGEERLDDWVASVDVVALPKRPSLPVLGAPASASFPLAELSAALDAAVAGLYAGLDAVPLHACERTQGWAMLETEPSSRVGSRQPDLVMATTFVPEMLKSFLQGDPFSSRRFSRAGERFAYLAVDGEGKSPAARLPFRRAVEDSLDRELSRAALGCVVGNGVGVHHDYINLALTEVCRGVELVRDVARRMAAPQRSRILFCDSDWADEWVGVWEA
jgi:hypothetical protein